MSNAFDYISDENKCIVNEKDIELAYMEETPHTETSFIEKEEYRRLKKFEYSTSLAQDVYYCYGLEYKSAQKSKTENEHMEPQMQE